MRSGKHIRTSWKIRAYLRRARLKIGIGLALILLACGLAWQTVHQHREIWNWSVGNKTILIDAGHGGVDPGAVGRSDTLEKDITLAIALRLKPLMEQGGAKVIMVREDDRDLGTSPALLKRKREDLAQRIQLAVDSETDIYLSIHANSFPNAKSHGPQVFYHADSLEGKELAQAIQRELNLLTGEKRVAKANQDLFILKRSSQIAVTVEVGFLSNEAEEQLLTTEDYQEKLAMAIYKGVCGYLGR